MNNFAEQYAKNVLAFYRTLLCQEPWDFAKDATIKAIPYLSPVQGFPYLTSVDELGIEEDA